MDTNLAKSQIVSLLTVTDSNTEVSIKLGWISLGFLLEEDGFWFLADGHYNPLGMRSFNTKEAALAALLEYWKNDD
jgi:hypothetical protein